MESIRDVADSTDHGCARGKVSDGTSGIHPCSEGRCKRLYLPRILRLRNTELLFHTCRKSCCQSLEAACDRNVTLHGSRHLSGTCTGRKPDCSRAGRQEPGKGYRCVPCFCLGIIVVFPRNYILLHTDFMIGKQGAGTSARK